MESIRRHTSDVEPPPIDQDCLKQFEQVIRDNINIFRKSIANKKFLHALKNGQVLSFSGEVIRVTREAMKSFEFIDAAKFEATMLGCGFSSLWEGSLFGLNRFEEEEDWNEYFLAEQLAWLRIFGF
ncbi:unnamed protein product [Cuscuta campestris]|uniref:Uncharacterized protein n=1 Tax=Cuscuta campestris TaxID=132261 RepID=A0A484LSV8_9ASTE|nr:unnamed protein product [Cuscuta campestris]